MSTPEDHLEARVWLETAHPDLPAEKREAFYEAVGQYYRESPTAERDGHYLSALQEDHEAFPGLLREIIAEGPGSSPS